MNRQKTKKDATKELIIKEASKLFSLLGYEKTTLEQILENANIAKGTFYYHFKSKEQLVEEMINNGYANFSTIVSQDLESGISPLEILNKVIDKFIDWTLNNPDQLKVVLSQRFSMLNSLNPENKAGSFREITSYLFSIAQKNGEMKNDIKPMELAQMLGMMLVQAQLSWVFNREIDLKEKCFNCLEVFLNGTLNK
ncbi:MAG: TetR/AcrR family transcriptional regulator [Candidatus Sericytochromatia bacterium]